MTAKAEPQVLEWNGHDVPAELAGLPPGRYVIAPVNDAWELIPDEDAGLREGLDPIDRGEVVDAEVVCDRLEARLRGPAPR